MWGGDGMAEHDGGSMDVSNSDNTSQGNFHSKVKRVINGEEEKQQKL
jgi:hypothetical protein